MPSVSKSQQALFGMSLAVKRGEKQLSDIPEGIRDEVKNIVDSMTEDQIKDYASTPTEDLPDTVTEALNKVRILEKDYSQEQRDEMAKSGEAMPDGSFPIKDKTDVENAVKLAHMSSHPENAKAHIKKRAKALGAEDSLPDDWVKENAQEAPKKRRLKLMSEAVSEAMNAAVGYDISQDQIKAAAESADIDISAFDIEELCIGVGIEMEHGSRDPETNVTNDDLVATLKIALAHLKENPNYYLELLASGVDEDGTGGDGGGSAGMATLGSVNGIGGWQPGIQAGKRKLTDREKEFLQKNKNMTGPGGNTQGIDSQTANEALDLSKFYDAEDKRIKGDPKANHTLTGADYEFITAKQNGSKWNYVLHKKNGKEVETVQADSLKAAVEDFVKKGLVDKKAIYESYKVGDKYHAPAPEGGEEIDFIITGIDGDKYTIDTFNKEGRKNTHTFAKKDFDNLVKDSKKKK